MSEVAAAGAVVDQLPKEEIPVRAKKLRGWIVGLTSVLVVVPAMINAGMDIYSTLMDRPVTEAEQINEALFERYFGKAPVFQGSVPIVTEAGSMEITLEVHGAGDIFVRYGDRSQWFPSPLAATSTAGSGFSLISAAIAADLPLQLPQQYQQRETREDGRIVREMYLPDGEKRVYRIDPKTGRWSAPTVEQYQNVPQQTQQVQRSFEFPTIDLTRPRAVIAPSAPPSQPQPEPPADAVPAGSGDGQ